jgi:hypothetical protein
LLNDLFRAAKFTEVCVGVIGGVGPIDSSYDVGQCQRAPRLGAKAQSGLSNMLEATYTATRTSVQQRKMTKASMLSDELEESGFPGGEVGSPVGDLRSCECRESLTGEDLDRAWKIS